MKKMKWLVALAIACSTQVAFADNEDACYDCCDNDGQWSANVDYLLWKTNRSELYLHSGHAPRAAEGGEKDCGTRFVNPDHESGWRVGLSRACGCWDFGLRYTSYYDSAKVKKSEKKHGHYDVDGYVARGAEESEDAALGGNGGRKSRYSIDMDVLDVELGYPCALNCGCCGTIRPFIGAQWAWIDESAKIYDYFKGKQKFKGAGLYLGAEGEWNVCNYDFCGCVVPITLVTRASTGILDSEFTVKAKYCDNRKKECLYVTHNELLAGLAFRFCDVGCGDLDVLVAYEVHHFCGWREFDSYDDLASLGVGGLTFRLAMDF